MQASVSAHSYYSRLRAVIVRHQRTEANAVPAVQIDYNTTLTGRPVTIGASGGLIANQNCSDTTCSASAEIDVNELSLLDESGSSDEASQYGYWDVTYSNFTSKVDPGYKTEDFTFQYSNGGYTSCSKTITETGASPNRFCTGELEVQFETTVVPDRCKTPGSHM